MSGNSSVNSDGGDIHFNGQLDQNGNYQFTSNGGDIDLNLPDNSSMHIKTNPGIGSFHSEFPDEASSTAIITLDSNGGDVDIEKQ